MGWCHKCHKFFVILMFFILPILGDQNQKATDMETRSIVGGHSAKSSYPFYVYLRMKLGNWDAGACGGTIVSENVVLTAAHCVYYKELGRQAYVNEIEVWVSDFTVPSWQQNVVKYQLKRFSIHRNYNASLPYNDIAVLEIDGSFDMSSQQSLPICRGGRFYERATAIGLGVVEQFPNRKATVLQEALLFRQKNCQSFSKYEGAINYEKQVCFSDPGKRGVCNGDSGGPLVAHLGSERQCLLGVASFVHKKGCVHGEFPGVFTRAGYNSDWIDAFVMKSEAN